MREKRKYSGDIDSISGKGEDKKQKNSKIKVPSFLNSLKNNKNQALLTKSPSHQIIGVSKKHVLNDK